MNYCDYIISDDLKDKLRFEGESHTDDFVFYPAENQTSIKLISIARLNNTADIS